MGGNFVWVFLVGGEFAIPCTSYDFHTTKNKMACLNRLHPYCAIMEARDAELVEGLSKKSVPADNREEVEGLSKCCIVQLFLESCHSLCVQLDFYR